MSTTPQTKSTAVVPSIFDCYLVSTVTDAEQLRRVQLCFNDWLRTYVTVESNLAATFLHLETTLLEYQEIDDLLTLLIQNASKNVDNHLLQTVASAILFTHVGSLTEEVALNHREFIRDAFMSYVPQADAAPNDQALAEHAWSFSTLNEFMSKALYVIQDANYMVNDLVFRKEHGFGEDADHYAVYADALRISATQPTK